MIILVFLGAIGFIFTFTNGFNEDFKTFYIEHNGVSILSSEKKLVLERGKTHRFNTKYTFDFNKEEAHGYHLSIVANQNEEQSFDFTVDGETYAYYEVGDLTDCFKIVEGDDYFKVDITKRLLAAYLYKLGSILYRHRPELQAEAAKPLKREEILFKEFIRLVSEYHRKERRVDFYADQLFLSSKHFSTVIKKVSGKTAGEWIDEYVILEAKTLLKYSAMSIQEVAYYMNFPNPSFFGKYFKHHTGMSPSEYKTQM